MSLHNQVRKSIVINGIFEWTKAILKLMSGIRESYYIEYYVRQLIIIEFKKHKMIIDKNRLVINILFKIHIKF